MDNPGFTPKMGIKAPEKGQAEFKINRGGWRPGSGRKSNEKKNLVQRKLSMALPPEVWSFIDDVRRLRPHESQSDILRSLIAPATEILRSNNEVYENIVQADDLQWYVMKALKQGKNG